MALGITDTDFSYDEVNGYCAINGSVDWTADEEGTHAIGWCEIIDGGYVCYRMSDDFYVSGNLSGVQTVLQTPYVIGSMMDIVLMKSPFAYTDIVGMCQEIVPRDCRLPDLCKQHFAATDTDGGALPFTAKLDLYEERTAGWVKIGEIHIPSGESVYAYLSETVKHKTVAHVESGWKVPNEKTFIACQSKITSVYTKEGDDDDDGILDKIGTKEILIGVAALIAAYMVLRK